MATVASRKQANTDRRVPSRQPKKTAQAKKLKVVELFAGVGGFRVGFERASDIFETVWFNQWEPAESFKAQHAWNAYCNAFKIDPLIARDAGTNTDINHIVNEQMHQIPAHDLLVGGFPCQDYSVAKPLSQSAGLTGKKGVLWWSIHKILADHPKPPKYLMLENVDRLLKSPGTQRGRDFGIMLATLSDLGYAVEWRVINAADYGMPQRRRRIYILGYKKGTPMHAEIRQVVNKGRHDEWISTDGLIASTFPVNGFAKATVSLELTGDAHDLTRTFGGKVSPFDNSGFMIDRKVWTAKVVPAGEKDKAITLRHILEEARKHTTSEDLKKFIVDSDRLKDWQYAKGAKAEERVDKKTGYKYKYTEGSMPFPDPLDKPSRTIVTGEGGATPSRFKHVVKDGKVHRRLTPVELELLNMFPANHTKMEGISDVKRAFFMGNALVVGIVERLGKELAKRAY